MDKPTDYPTKLKLHGFNNLTKTLSFNIYDICYAKTAAHRKEYLTYIHEAYNAKRLTDILTDVTYIIGANILNVAYQDYDPQGASVTMLIAEEKAQQSEAIESSEAPGPLPEAIVSHLDKSHIAVHTYPESHPESGLATFRVDIDVSTCGVISPLKALNYLIHSFESDIVTIDYRIRGFTRDVTGSKHFIDHPINSIQNYLAKDTCHQYQTYDVNVYHDNIFHTKMLINDYDLDNYLFGAGKSDFSAEELTNIQRMLKQEMLEIFYGRNLRALPQNMIE